MRVKLPLTLLIVMGVLGFAVLWRTSGEAPGA